MWSFFAKDSLAEFPYDIGIKIEPITNGWTLFSCKKRKTKSIEPIEYSLFKFEVNDNDGNSEQMKIAKNMLQRCRTIRHPDLVAYVDSLQSDKMLYLVTEYVQPLASYLKHCGNHGSMTFTVSWGLFQIVRALIFLHDDCNLLHGQIEIESIVVSRAGDWKVAGLGYVRDLVSMESFHNTKEPFAPPDALKLRTRRDMETADSWGLGCLLWQILEGQDAGTLTSWTQLRSCSHMPESLLKHYHALTARTAGRRPTMTQFFKDISQPDGFCNNYYVTKLQFLEQIEIKSTDERSNFLKSLGDQVHNFPRDVAKFKVLPHLLHIFQYGGGGADVLLPLLKLAPLLESSEFERQILPCLVKLFASPDRSTRVYLLQRLPDFVQHLSESCIREKVFPSAVQGFQDTNPVVREHTVRALVYLAPKLSSKQLNEEVLQHLTWIQIKDEQGGLRANATICLCKLAGYFSPEIRQNKVLPALLRCLKDPFPPARLASVSGLASTLPLFTLNLTSTRLLPALCPLLTDSESSVREVVFVSIRAVIERLEHVHKNPAAAAEMESKCNTAFIASDLAINSVSGWANWAVSTLGNKFLKSTSASVANISVAASPANKKDGDLALVNDGIDGKINDTKDNAIKIDDNVGYLGDPIAQTAHNDVVDKSRFSKLKDPTNKTSTINVNDSDEDVSGAIDNKKPEDNWDSWISADQWDHFDNPENDKPFSDKKQSLTLEKGWDDW